MIKISAPCPECQKNYHFVLQFGNPGIEGVCGLCGAVSPFSKIIYQIILELVPKKRKKAVIQLIKELQGDI